MPTQMFLRNTASDLGGAGQWQLSTTRGAASANLVTNTIASGDNIPVTQAAGGQALSWFTSPLQLITVTGGITVNLRGLESATAANAAPGILIERCDSSGTVLSTIVPSTAVPATANEYGTTDAAHTSTITPTSTTLQQGNRIKVTVLVKAASGVAMGGARTVTNSVNGPTAAAAGDSYVTFAETLLAFAGATPQALAGVAALGAATVRANSSISPQVLAAATSIPTPAQPTAQFVKKVGSSVRASSSNVSRLTLATGVTVAAGNRLVVCFGGSINPTVGLICDDSRGNAYAPYVRAQDSPNADAVAAMWVAPVSTGLVAGDTITVTQGGGTTSSGTLAVYEWQGSTVPIVGTGQSGNSTTPSSGSISMPGGAVYIGMLTTFAASGSFRDGTLGSPWTSRDTIQQQTTSGFRSYDIWDRALPSAGGNVNFTPTLATATTWTAAQIALTQGTEPAQPSLLYSWTGNLTPLSATIVSASTIATQARVIVGTDTALSNTIYSSLVTPDADGYCKHLVTGLDAGTQYYYRVELNGVPQPSAGQFLTPPNGPANMVIATASCMLTQASTAWDRAMAKGPTFCLISGDLPYGDITSTDPAQHRGAREGVLARPEVNNLIRNVATAYVWSDHDYGSNNADTTNVGKAAAQSTYRKMIPHWPLPSTAEIYQTFTYGSRIRFILTDERSNKSPIGNTDNATKTMLGATQKQWLKDTVTAAAETLIIWMGDTTWIGSTLSDDEWTGYSTERTELGNFFLASGKRIVRLSGDMHAMAYDNGASAAGRLPVIQAAPWAQTPSIKGGPYTQGPYPASGSTTLNQYTILTITDDGTTMRLRMQGYDTTDVVRIDATLQWITPATITGVASIGAVTATKHATVNPPSLAAVADLPVANAIGDDPSATPETIACVVGMGVDRVPPSVPTGLHGVSASATSVDLAWNPSTDNFAVAGYEVVIQAGG